MTENGDYVKLIKKNASILDSLCRDHYVMICPAVSILHWHFEGLERVATLIMHLSQLNKKFTIKFSFRNFMVKLHLLSGVTQPNRRHRYTVFVQSMFATAVASPAIMYMDPGL